MVQGRRCAVAAVIVAAFFAAFTRGLGASDRQAGGQPPQDGGDRLGLEPGCFDDFQGEQFPSAEELRKLLAERPGEPFQLAEVRAYDRPVIQRFQGLMRLTVPWPAESALRFSILQPAQLQLHLWSGREGVTLRYYPEFHQCWAAYATTRDGNAARPASHVLLATSEDRYRRTGPGTIHLVRERASLVMVRGAVELLRVPLSGPASEVYFEGGGLVRGLAVVPAAWAGAPRALRPAKTVLPTVPPAELPWEMKPVEGVSLKKLGEGRVELAAAAKAQPAQASVSLGGTGLYEILIDVEQPEPGTGFFLGDNQGRQFVRLAFPRHRETGKATFELVHQWSGELEKSYDAHRQVIPFCGQRQWLRIVCGAGIAKCWTSGDGVHWSQPAPSAVVFDGGCSQIGLYCIAADKPRAIRLCGLGVRRLDVLTGLARAEVRRRVPAQDKVASPEAWEELVAKSRPEDVAEEDWRRACAVEYLVAPAKGVVAQAVLGRLVASIAEEPGNLAAGLDALGEAAQLSAPDDWALVDRWVGWSADLGRAAAYQGHPAPFTALSDALLRLPFWHSRALPVYHAALLRHELWSRVERGKWDELHAFCRRLRHYNAAAREANQALWDHAVEHLLRWAESVAAQGLPKGKTGTAISLRPSLLGQHPLIEHVSRDAYNIGAELTAAIRGESYREACQIITAMPAPESLGLFRDPADVRLLVSAPLAVRLALRDREGLRQVMQADFAVLGRLRLKRGIAAGDRAAILTVAQQFAGTEVAAEAERWLGDRAISCGEFVSAVQHYRRAVPSTAAGEQGELLARLRLAGAMSGQEQGAPAEVAVRLGATSFTAPEFEQLVQQLRQTHRPGAGSPPAIAAAALPPGRYRLQPWATIEGREVKRPPGIPERGLDWAGRQIAVVVAGNQMFANNRFEQMAFDLPSGQLQWIDRIAIPHSPPQSSLTPMTPVVVGGRVFTRRLTKEGPELACFDAAEGKLIWNTKPDSLVVSDPLFIGPELLAFSVAAESSKLSLFLLNLGPGSGRVRNRTLVAEFRDVWHGQLSCQAVAIEDRIVATTGGCVVVCDAAGQVQWIRRQIWIPAPNQDYSTTREWLRQVHRPPLVAGGKVYATQPGVFGMECLDLESGRLLWRRAVENMAGLVGRVSHQVIVETGEGLAAYDGTDGRGRWRRSVEHCLHAVVCNPPGIVAFAEIGPKRTPPAPIQLGWLDGQSGRILATSALEGPLQAEPWLGPVVLAHGRQWALIGSPQQAARREIMELKSVQGTP